MSRKKKVSAFKDAVSRAAKSFPASPKKRKPPKVAMPEFYVGDLVVVNDLYRVRGKPQRVVGLVMRIDDPPAAHHRRYKVMLHYQFRKLNSGRMIFSDARTMQAIGPNLRLPKDADQTVNFRGLVELYNVMESLQGILG